MLESKQKMRNHWAQLSFAEKIRILEQLNERARGLRDARLKWEAKQAAKVDSPAGST